MDRFFSSRKVKYIFSIQTRIFIVIKMRHGYNQVINGITNGNTFKIDNAVNIIVF